MINIIKNDSNDAENKNNNDKRLPEFSGSQTDVVRKHG